LRYNSTNSKVSSTLDFNDIFLTPPPANAS
jgi:hypothetical protein